MRGKIRGKEAKVNLCAIGKYFILNEVKNCRTEDRARERETRHSFDVNGNERAFFIRRGISHIGLRVIHFNRSLAFRVSMRCHCVSFLFSHRKNRAINYRAVAHIFFLFAFEQK